ncbi:thiamine biosynthesis protein ThiF [Nonomuraea mesophila]|uniref:thiamine biosynthesis protein ThiF n=1 Tax=Nonomuraea mesophila TaxID=2530382 RepID=UPI00140AC9EE|nr:thiamine biosynthesis protein ThiF [Nonomuraea mesophila]
MRPRVKPALRRIVRDEHTLQYGAHPLRSVLLSGLTRPVRAWIESLDGTRELEQVLRGAADAGLGDDCARSVLDQLIRQGAVHDAGAGPGSLRDLSLAERDRLRPELDALDLASTSPEGGIAVLERRRGKRVRVYGAGKVGAQVVALLAGAGVGTVRVFDPGVVRPGDITPGGLTWAELGQTREAGAVAVARRLTSGGRTPSAPTPAAPSGPAVRPPSTPTPAAQTRPAVRPPSTPTPAAPSRPAGRPPSPGPEATRASRAAADGGRPSPPVPRSEPRGEEEVAPSVDAVAGGPYLGDATDRPDLVVLAPVDPLDGVLVNELTALGIPHLLATAFEGHGLLGPLVLPGRSACLHCLDLTRRDHDPAWPIVTARLGGYPPGEIACDSTLAALVAAAATGHALAHLDGRESVVTNGTVDVTPDWRWRRRSWTIHPQCRCMRNNPYSLRMVMA